MGEYKALVPAADAFDKYSTGYAQGLAKGNSGSLSIDSANLRTLGHLAQGDSGRYLAALQGAEASQRAGQLANNYTEETGKRLDAISSVNHGLGIGSRYIVSTDQFARPEQAQTAAEMDMQGGDRLGAAAYKDRTAGAKDAADAGYGLSGPNAAKFFAGPNESNPIPYTEGYLPPAQVAAERDADVQAATRKYAVDHHVNPGDGAQITVTPGMFPGLPTSFQGKGRNVQKVMAMLAAAQAADDAEQSHGGGGRGSTATAPKPYIGKDGKYYAGTDPGH